MTLTSNNTILRFLNEIFGIIGDFLYYLHMVLGFSPILSLCVFVIVFWGIWLLASLIIQLVKALLHPIGVWQRNRLIKETYSTLYDLAEEYARLKDRTDRDAKMFQGRALEMLIAAGMPQEMINAYLKAWEEYELHTSHEGKEDVKDVIEQLAQSVQMAQRCDSL